MTDKEKTPLRFLLLAVLCKLELYDILHDRLESKDLSEKEEFKGIIAYALSVMQAQHTPVIGNHISH